jgi:hypothetical protein
VTDYSDDDRDLKPPYPRHRNQSLYVEFLKDGIVVRRRFYSEEYGMKMIEDWIGKGREYTTRNCPGWMVRSPRSNA